MQFSKKTSFKISSVMAAFVAVLLSFALMASGAQAQENPRVSATDAPVNLNAKGPKRYFVEFRSRSALSYGHTFLVHGKLNAKGQVGPVSKDMVAGLHPATDSSIPWMIGHVIPVVSEQGWSDGDNEDEYITAAYRINLTEPEYAKVSAYIRQHQKNSPLWHAVLYNCNAWVGDVARFMGLKAPENTLLYPEDYITKLAALNGGKATRPNPQLKPAPLPGVPVSRQTTTRTAKPAAKPQTATTSPASQTTGGTPAGQTVATPASAAPEQTVR